MLIYCFGELNGVIWFEEVVAYILNFFINFMLHFDIIKIKLRCTIDEHC